MNLNSIENIDAKDGVFGLPEGTIHCCVSSIPYYGLRDYGIAKSHWPAITYSLFGFEINVPEMECCLGLERTPKEFVGHVVHIYRGVWNSLREDGTNWLNIGDSYSAAGKKRTKEQACRKSNLTGGKASQIACKDQPNKIVDGIKAKDLMGIPWMVAMALREDGWFLRQDIIWSKPNPMPESVTDRCTKSHEYIFLLTKSNKYFFDQLAIATDYRDKTYTTFGIESKGHGDGSGLIQSENWARDVKVRKPKDWGKTLTAWQTGKGSHDTIKHNSDHDRDEEKKRRFDDSNKLGLNGSGLHNHSGNYDSEGNLIGSGKANKRSVWTVSPKPFKEAHFATFPEELIIDCIKSGCPENGIVLDPFMGAGTTALVAQKLQRNFIGFELNPEYIKIANKRLRKELGLFHPEHKTA